MENSRNNEFVSLKLDVTLSSVMKSHTFCSVSPGIESQYLSQLSDRLSQYTSTCVQVTLIVLIMAPRCKISCEMLLLSEKYVCVGKKPQQIQGLVLSEVLGIHREGDVCLGM